MGQTADTVAVEVEARLNATSAAAAAAQFDQTMNRISASAGRAEQSITQSFSNAERQLQRIFDPAAYRQSRLFSQVQGDATQMGTAIDRARGQSARLGVQIGQLGSSLGSGINPMVVFAQQASDFAYTLNGVGGVAGKVAAFFSTPWGAALLAAGAVVGILISKHKSQSSALEEVLDKMKKTTAQAALNAEANRIYAQSEEGLAAAIRKRREEQEKALQTDVRSEQDALNNAQKDINDARNEVGKLRKQLTAAQSERSRIAGLALNVGSDPSGGTGILTSLSNAEARVKDLQDRLTKATLSVFDAEAEARAAQATISQRNVDAALDPVKKATDAYTKALGELNAQLRLNIVTQAEYDAKLLAAGKIRDAAIKAAREQQKADGDTTQFLRPVTGGTVTGGFGDQRPGHLHAGVDIAVPTGTEVRAPAGGVIIESGVVAGYGQAIYIDHGRGTITRLGHLSQRDVTVGQTVEAGQLLGLSGNSGHSTGPHLHFEVRQGGRPVDPFGAHPVDVAGTSDKAEQLARKAEAEAKLAADQTARFDAEMAKLNNEEIIARRGRITTVEQQLEVQQAQITTERDAAIASYERGVVDKQITAKQAELLIAKAQHVAAAKALALADEDAFRRTQLQQALYGEQQQAQVDQLRFEADNKKTGEERRNALLKLLDAETTLQRIRLQQTIDATIAGTADHEIAVLKLSQLADEKARNQYSIEHNPQNMSPGARYLDELNQSTGQLGEAVDNTAVDALHRLNTELADAIFGTGSLTDAWKNFARSVVQGLAEIAIQQLIIKPMAQLLFGGTGSGGLGGGGGLLASLGSLFGGGGLTDSGALDLLGAPGAAFGARVTAGSPVKVGEFGQELFVPTSDGVVVPNNALASLGGRGGSGGGTVVVRVAANDYFDAHVTDISGNVSAQVVREAAPQIVAVATANTASALGRRKM